MKKTAQIFVVGNSRSGTTMMGKILHNHPLVHTFHELHFFEHLWTTADMGKVIDQQEAITLYARLLKNEYEGLVSHVDYKKYRDQAQVQIQSLPPPITRELVFKAFLENETRQDSKLIACEQTPRNILYAKEILQLFPECNIIAMVRDPRDVVLSQKGKWKRRFLGGKKHHPLSEAMRSWINYHSITMSKLWKHNYNLIRSIQDHPRVLVIKFENLVQAPKQEIEKICDFAGIDYQQHMLQVPQAGSSSSTDQSELGIKNTTGKWKNGGLRTSELFLCQLICKKEMEDAGYSISDIRPSLFSLWAEKIMFPVKLALSLLFNLHRMKNIRESLGRRLTMLKG